MIYGAIDGEGMETSLVKISVQVGYVKEVDFKEGSEGDLASCRWEAISSVRGNMEKA